MSQTQAVGTDKSESLEEQACNVVDNTNRDGTISVEITNIQHDEDENTVTIEFLTPLNTTESNTFEFPKVESKKYPIIGICEQTVGSFKLINNIEGERVPADPSDWTLQPSVESRVESLRRKFQITERVVRFAFGIPIGISALTALFPIFLLFAAPFGIQVLSLFQGLSVLLIGTVFALSFAGIKEMIAEKVSEN